MKERVINEQLLENTDLSETVIQELLKLPASQRDEALLLLVKSGLIDQNTGLEIFDKNDFTATKDDKRIKLARAVNGELARLIRKMPNIDNASVLVSIPESTFFKADKKPVTAAVMLAVAIGAIVADWYMGRKNRGGSPSVENCGSANEVSNSIEKEK